jgi:nucleoside-diphosphate-sugar epimerase
MNVLLIGGSGFVGSHLTRRLLERGHQVSILTRDIEKPMPFDKSRVRMIQGDLVNLMDTVGIPNKLDMMVFLAMPPFKPGHISSRQFENIKTTTRRYLENTIQLAKQIDCPLVLTTGTSYITRGDEVADESWPIARVGMAAVGESYDELVPPIRRQGNPPLIEMIPAQIYGRGGLFKHMIDMAESGRVLIFGDGKNYIPRIHVEDCAEAYLRSIEQKPFGKRFIISDDVPCSVEEFSQHLAQVFDARQVIHVPAFILRIVLGKYIYPTIMMNARVSNALIKSELGWQPKFPSYREGLQSLAEQDNRQVT